MATRSSPVHRSGRPLNPADALRAPASPRGSAQVTHVPIQVGSPVFPARCPARGPRGFPASTHALELHAAALNSLRGTQRPRARPRRTPGPGPAHPPRTYPAAARRPGVRARSPARWRFLLPGGAGRAPAFPPCRVTAAPPAERGAAGRAARGDDRDPRGWRSGSPGCARHAGCKVQEDTPSSGAQRTGARGLRRK